ncbi:MAG: PRC-barrel domain-containing protein [Methanosarcinaceae archaeon]|nr:PRC-barrel domain-containing protein [Methanosarcinaceae archaeon]
MRAEITSLFGLNIYTDAGTYVGKVSDVVLDANERKVTGIAASNVNRDLFDITTKGIIIPYRWVVTTGDIVIIRDVISKFKKTENQAGKE